MAVTNGWGQGVINNTNGWGKLATNNIGAGSVYENSASGDTALIGTSAAFSYSASSFTQADADPTPTITGTTGGTFSGTSGLVFVSTSTGQIDLSASTIAAHVVTYTVGGVSSNFNLSVTAAPFASTQSFDFDGVDDFIGVSSLDTSVLPTGSFSISTWFNTSGGGFGGLVQVGDFAGNVAFNLVKGGSRNIIVQLELSGGQKLISTPNFQFNENEWNNLILVFDNSTTLQSFKIYVNNVLKVTNNESPSGQTIVYPANSELRLGQWNNIGTTNNYFFEGNIDETAIFNTALSSSDVATIYGTGVPNDISSLNPVAWYRMGENSNYKSPQWLMPENSNKDKFSNYSFEFDGVDDFIEIGSPNSIQNLTSVISISFWIKVPKVFSTNYYTPLSKGEYAASGSQWSIKVNTANQSNTIGGTFSTFSQANAISGRENLNFPTAVDDNQWHHMLFVNDGTDLKIFIDGQLDATGTGQGGTLYDGNRSLKLGKLTSTSSTGLLQGNLDEISIFGTGLELSDAQFIYNSGVPNDISSLSPVAHWRVGEEANFTNNWLINNSALSNYSTRSFQFDGVDDQIDLPDIPFLRGGGQHFSISVWVLTTHTTQAGFFAARVAPSQTNLIRLFRNTNRQAVLEIKSSSTGDLEIRSSNNSLTTNNWHHIVATFDGTQAAAADRVNMYIDGVLDNAYQTGTGTNLPSGTSGIMNFIGRTFLGLRQTGLIDELAIFNTTLSSSDVTTIYNSGVPTTLPSGAVAHYRMGEKATFSTNWTIPDQVGSNTGTSSNMDLSDLVGDAPNYTGAGLSNNMTIEDRVGDAPNSSSNAVSFNMTESDRETDVPS